MTNDATMTAGTMVGTAIAGTAIAGTAIAGTAIANTTVGAAGPRLWARSAGAVLAGTLASAALALGTDEALHLIGLFPPITQVTYDASRFVVATAYRVVFAVLGFYIIARVAPRRPRQHVWAGAAIGLAGAAAGIAATLTSDMGPPWYPIALAVTTLPCAWLGGTLRARQA